MKDNRRLSTVQPKLKEEKKKEICSETVLPKSQRQHRRFWSNGVHACVRVHQKSLKRSLMSLKRWDGGPLKQQWISLFPHTVNHTHLRWGLERRPAWGQSPTACAILWGPPSVREQEEGASSRDGNLSNQTTQVVHLGGQLKEDFCKKKKKKMKRKHLFWQRCLPYR